MSPGFLDGPAFLTGLPEGLFRKTIGLVDPLAGLTPLASAALPLASGARMLTLSRLSLWAAWLLLAGLTAGGLLLAAAPSRPQTKSPPPDKAAAPANDVLRADRLGDPLPPEAVARLGNNRLRGQRCLFLPDGRRVLREWGGNWQISEVSSGKPLVLICGSDIPQLGTIVGSSIAFSPDGKYLAAVCRRHGRCGIWETATGKLVRRLESGDYSSSVRCDFSPDGKLLAVEKRMRPDTIHDAVVSVFEIESGRRLFSVLGTNSTFAVDGRSLVAWNAYAMPPKARRVAVPTGKELATLDYHGYWTSFTTATDGTLFFDILTDGDVRVHDMAAGKMKHTLRGPKAVHENPVWVKHASGRRELLAVGGKPAGVWCWDKDAGRLLWQAPLPAEVQGAEISSDGKTLAISESSGQVRVWDVPTGKQRSSFRPAAIGHEPAVAVSPLIRIDGELHIDRPMYGREGAVAVSPDGKTIATSPGGIFSTSLAFWDAATGKRLSTLPGHASEITAAAFAPDGLTVYTIGKDRTLRNWCPASGRQRSQVPAEPAASLIVSGDGKTLFAAGADAGTLDVLYGRVENLGRGWPRELADAGVVRVLDAQTGKERRKFRAFRGPLHGMAVTADGKRLFTAGRDGQTSASLVRILDAESGAKLARVQGVRRPPGTVGRASRRQGDGDDGGRTAGLSLGRQRKQGAGVRRPQ